MDQGIFRMEPALPPSLSERFALIGTELEGHYVLDTEEPSDSPVCLDKLTEGEIADIGLVHFAWAVYCSEKMRALLLTLPMDLGLRWHRVQGDLQDQLPYAGVIRTELFCFDHEASVKNGLILGGRYFDEVLSRDLLPPVGFFSGDDMHPRRYVRQEVVDAIQSSALSSSLNLTRMTVL